MKIKLLALLFLGIFSTAGSTQTTEEVYEFWKICHQAPIQKCFWFSQ